MIPYTKELAKKLKAKGITPKLFIDRNQVVPENTWLLIKYKPVQGGVKAAVAQLTQHGWEVSTGYTSVKITDFGTLVTWREL